MALGVVAAEMNYKILPYMPIAIKPEQGTNETTPEIKELGITALTTAGIELFPRPHFNSTLQTEFKQEDIMGIFLSFSFVWDKNISLFMNSQAIAEVNDEFIYFGENLSAHLLTILEIYDSQGKLVANSDNIHLWGGGGSSSGANETIWRKYYVKIPCSWEPGAYTLKAHVEDLITTLEDSEETAVNILIGPPLEEPHPTPIAMKPEDMIIGLEDLPDGWTVVWENPNWTILEGCISSFERRFSKVVGNFTKDFDVRVIQYENVDVAKKSFDGRLEGALAGERYGHGEVVMADIGDSGFLYDRAERRTPEWRGWHTGSKYFTGWSTGSSITFIKQNIVVVICASYNDEAVSRGTYITNEKLIEFARIQEAKISS
jgi:hypothetical protein